MVNTRSFTLGTSATENGYLVAGAPGNIAGALIAHRDMPLPDALDAPRHWLDSDYGKRINYYSNGPATGRPLVLVHSINAAPSAFEMKPLFEHYRSQRPVYALDLPGFGFSDRSERRYSPELFANSLVEFLTKVVKEPADVAAFSLSSEFAARAALSAPERISSLVVISPTGFSKRNLPVGALSNGLHRFLTLPLLSQGLYDALTSRPSIRYFMRQYFTREPPVEFIEYAYATSHQTGARHAPLYFLSGHLFTPNTCDELYGKLKLPALALYDRDPNTSFDRLPEFVAQHPNWKAVRIEATMGMSHWDKLPETTAAMDRFWIASGRV